MTKKILTAERLHEVLRYDPETGGWTWFVARQGCKVGGVAGTIRKKDGRRMIKIDGRDYLSSRLAVLYISGAWPEHEVDHRDLDRGNDRWNK